MTRGCADTLRVASRCAQSRASGRCLAGCVWCVFGGGGGDVRKGVSERVSGWGRGNVWKGVCGRVCGWGGVWGRGCLKVCVGGWGMCGRVCARGKGVEGGVGGGCV